MSNTTKKTFNDFYLHADGDRSMFEVWEDGGSQGDAVTPSTYSSPYQDWMGDLLRKFLDQSARPALLSIGCGNARIESGLVKDGYRVLAVDMLEKAVELAQSKGVDALRADVMTWSPPKGACTVVYADGLLGHLYNSEGGLQPFLTRVRSWLEDGDGVLVVSNDAPGSNDDVAPHTGLDGFYWLSTRYLCRQIAAAGFHDVWSTLFTYERPVSGVRERAILTARA